MTDFELLKYGHKISRSLMPDSIMNIMNQNQGRKEHRYNTRNKSLPNIQKRKSTAFNQNFIIKSIAHYQTLPMCLKQIPSLKQFSKKFKHQIVGNFDSE